MTVYPDTCICMDNDHLKQKELVGRLVVPWLNTVSLKEQQPLDELKCLEEASHLLMCPSFGFSEMLLRRIVDLISFYIPSSARLAITGTIKTWRNPQRVLKIRYPLDGELNQHLFQLKKKLSDAEQRVWNGKSAVVCISHDVDTREGYQFLPEVFRLDHDYGIPAVINLLTHSDYHVAPALLTEFLQEGFEIGFHGYRHELGLAKKPYQRIIMEFTRALDFLGSLRAEVKGFRAPGLSISPTVLAVLNDLGFVYDSSMQLCSSFSHSCGVSFPYRYPGKPCWELPLTVQDSLLFRDAVIEDEQALQVLETILQHTLDLGGVAFFNFHPCLIKKRTLFYIQFLELLTTYQESFWFVSPQELCSWLEQSIAGENIV